MTRAAMDVPVETGSPGTTPIFGAGSPLQNVLALGRRVARTDCNVLVTGESGTGKEVVVKALHGWSNRRRGALVTVNCGAIPEQLLESELFGYAKGAFTGADKSRVGRFEMADKGTIFLDEVGDLPHPLQVKLLRVIQERRVQPLGGARPKDLDFRLVAATNATLETSVREGRFREDLYFRLNVLRLHLPPLRERTMDVPPLVDHFVATYNERYFTEIQGLTEGAMRLMARQRWPGNVRELENFVQGLMVIVGEGWIQEDDVASHLAAIASHGSLNETPPAAEGPLLDFPDTGIDLNDRVDTYETQLIQEALRRADNNKTRAARLLGVNRTTLVEKLKRKGLA